MGRQGNVDMDKDNMGRHGYVDMDKDNMGRHGNVDMDKNNMGRHGYGKTTLREITKTHRKITNT